MNRKGIKIPSKKFHEFVENFMKSLGVKGLTLSLPNFWQFCSLSATFILTARGIVESQAYKFFKILIFQHFLSITFNKYPTFDVRKSRILWTLHNVYKQRDLNKVREGVQVADRRRWQSAMTSPIGDVGSERVKQGYLIERLKSSFREFNGLYRDLIQPYEVSLSRMLKNVLILDQ